MSAASRLTTATDYQMIQIRNRAYNADTRLIERTGIMLTHEQADSLGADGIDWLRDRLRLTVEDTGRGVECNSTATEPACARCRGSRYKLGECTTCGLASDHDSDEDE